MKVSPKQRLLAAIRGEKTDYVPFSPFLAYYFDFLPDKVKKKGELEYLKRIGADPLLRGWGQAYSTNFKGADISERITGDKRIRTISFSKGAFTFEYTYSKVANSWFLSDHPVKNREDLNLLIELFENVEVEPQTENVNELIRQIGEDGLCLPVVGEGSKTAFQSLLESWIGTENLVYFCMDYPDEINEVIRIMRAVNLKTVEYTAESDTAACISWEDSSTTNLSPSMYREYILPEISQWCNILNQAGKLYVQHACGHIKELLPLMAEQKVAAVESISPPPTGNVTVSEANAILPKNVALIGGIEPTQFLNEPIDELLDYVRGLLDVTKERGFILSNSDSCPPGVEYEKFVAIAQLVKSLGW